ncbi:MAG: hypothetical protein IT372_40815 [Polyangiaceae bacterium]|nr:hypothetical protein [Polyangiaceae bacterium]
MSRLREQPALLSKLVHKVLGADLDPALKVVNSTLQIADPEEVRPDLVFRGKRSRWLIVEVQNRIDPAKRRRWLLAATVLLNEHGKMGDVLVITSSPRVAAWAKNVASVRGGLGTRLIVEPVVLLLEGPVVEALLDPAEPELAVFAAWAMQRRHGPEAKQIVVRALELTGRLPPPLRQGQMRAIVGVLSRRMMSFVREVLMDPKKTPETPWFREFRLELEARGKAEGEVDGKRGALLVVLSARELPLTAAQRRRIEECTDVALLDRWIHLATKASSADEVLAPLPGARRKPAPSPRPAARRRASRA